MFSLCVVGSFSLLFLMLVFCRVTSALGITENSEAAYSPQRNKMVSSDCITCWVMVLRRIAKNP